VNFRMFPQEAPGGKIAGMNIPYPHFNSPAFRNKNYFRVKSCHITFKHKTPRKSIKSFL
jgi:hypothetical protein